MLLPPTPRPVEEARGTQHKHTTWEDSPWSVHLEITKLLLKPALLAEHKCS